MKDTFLDIALVLFGIAMPRHDATKIFIKIYNLRRDFSARQRVNHQALCLVSTKPTRMEFKI